MHSRCIGNDGKPVFALRAEAGKNCIQVQKYLKERTGSHKCLPW